VAFTRRDKGLVSDYTSPQVQGWQASLPHQVMTCSFRLPDKPSGLWQVMGARLAQYRVRSGAGFAALEVGACSQYEPTRDDHRRLA
jgi:hypothetical protein